MRNPFQRKRAGPQQDEEEKKEQHEDKSSDDQEQQGEPDKKPVGFWDSRLKKVRNEAFGKWVLTTTILMVFIIGLLSIYWAAFYNIEQNLTSIVVYVADFDGRVAPYTNVEPVVGPIVRQLVAEKLASSAPRLGWRIADPSEFNNDPIAVRQAVYDWAAWAAIIVNANATALLQSAVQTGNTTYDPLGACQLVYISSRDNTAWFDYISPMITSFQTEATTMVGERWTQQVLQNAAFNTSLLASASAAPQALSPAIGFSQYDLRPFFPYTATPAVSIGLIYLIIVAFFSFPFYLPIHMNYLKPQKGMATLKFWQLIIWRWFSTISAYFMISLAYSLISLALQINFHYTPPVAETEVFQINSGYPNPGQYGSGTFVVYWMLNFFGMIALGLACENVAMIVGQPWTALWLIFWVITNVSTAFYNIDVEPGFYRWGYAWPLHYVVEGSRQILFDLRNTLGLDFGVLIAWGAVNTALFPLACYFMAWKSKKGVNEYYDLQTRSEALAKTRLARNDRILIALSLSCMRRRKSTKQQLLAHKGPDTVAATVLLPAKLATTIEQTGYAQNGAAAQYAYPDPLQLAVSQEQYPTPPPAASAPVADGTPDSSSSKRKGPPSRVSKKPDKRVRRVGPKPESEKAASTPGGDGEEGEGSKPKRVRTGCLTCRERHLKCDEAWPHCMNCRKSNRQCKRGIKLNFIDTWAQEPPTIVTAFGTDRWKVDFLDESREIASEYVGGDDRYPPLETAQPGNPMAQMLDYSFGIEPPPAPALKAEPLPAVQNHMMAYPPADLTGMFEDQTVKPAVQTYYALQPQQPPQAQVAPVFAPPAPQAVYPNGTQAPLPEEKKDFLNSAEETLFMQVFVEEVGLWMDSLDPMKHFSRLLPFHALSEPMLLNAFLACGAKHLTLVNPAYSADKALHYYDTATRYLLKNLQNPNRDTVICATTAVILNVYEVMSERSMQRMNHIAGARALIKECGWNARSTGIGSACFWLNVGLEVLSCLHFNWQVAWKPEDWGLEMDLSRETHNGMEETWTHRMLYIIGLVCQLRATAPKDVLPDLRAEQTRKQQRFEEWTRLKAMADTWNNNIPRTMHPMAYVFPDRTSSKSAFPEVWLVKRTTIVARLFYHTAMLLLAQINPYVSPVNGNEMAEMQRQHSQMTCGIVAHVKDRGVASVAIRSLAHAAEVLTERHEQEEVLQIFDKIHKETGWRIGFVYGELKEKWGWNEHVSPAQYAQTHEANRARENQKVLQQAAQNSMQMQQSYDYGQNQNMTLATPPQSGSNVISPASSQGASMRKLPSGIPNPMYREADFNLPQHPYQNFYVAPSTGFAGSQASTIW